MYKEFSLSPDIFLEPDMAKYLLSHFGHDQGRFITGPLRRWNKSCLENINKTNLPDVKRKRLKEKLRKIGRNKIIIDDFRRSTRWKDDQSWGEFVIQANKEISYHLIIDLNEDRCTPNMVTAEDIMDDEVSVWNVPHDKIFKRTAGDFIESIEGLVCISQGRIDLIDPYFSLAREEYRKTLTSLLEVLKQNKHIKEIAIHACSHDGQIETKSTIFSDQIAKYYQNNKVSLSFYNWPNKTFHDRYILTNVAALSFGHGLSVSKNHHPGDSEVNIKLCSLEVCNRYRTLLKGGPLFIETVPPKSFQTR